MQISLIKYLVAALSLPSMTISHPSTISLALSLVSLVSNVITLIWWLKASIDSFADIVLCLPIFFSVWITYLCRLDSSTTSPSTKPIVPIPAPAKYNPAGDPKPPAPTIKTLAAFNFFCPWTPISFIKSCLEYLENSSFVSSSYYWVDFTSI